MLCKSKISLCEDSQTLHILLSRLCDKKEQIALAGITCLFFLLFHVSLAHAQSPIPLRLVQTVPMSTFAPPSPDPAGIAYLSNTGILLVVDSEVDEMPQLFQGVNVFGVRLPNQLAYTRTVTNFTNEPTGVGFNPLNNHIFYTDDGLKRVFEVSPGADGVHGSSDDIRTTFRTNLFGNFDPEDVAFNPNTGELILAEGTIGNIYIISPGANGRFDGAAAEGGDDLLVRSFPTANLGVADPEGVAYDPSSNHLLITSRLVKMMAETTLTGSFVISYNLIAANPKIAAGVTMAPGSKNPTVLNYYIVDRGIDNNVDPTENDGKLYEMSRHGDGILYLSSSTNGSVGGFFYDDEDILAYDQGANRWSMFFDGSDVGLHSNDLDGFELQEDGTLLLSLALTTTLPDVGLVERSDILKFVPTRLGITTQGRFEWFLDGSDVGLSDASEDVDSIGLTAEGRLLISTLGNFTVPGLTGTDKDLLVLNNASFGANSSGTWARYLKGSSVQLASGSEDIHDVWQSPISRDLFLTTQGAYSVPGLSGDGDDIFVCTAASLGDNGRCTYRLFWNGDTFGFGTGIIDGLDIGDTLPVVSAEVDEVPEMLDYTDEGAIDEPIDELEDELEDEQVDGGGVIYLPFVSQ